MSAFYDFSARLLSGEEVKFDRFRGQVVLVVNTASKCGFTPQYAELQALYEEFAPHGFVVLAFPCNQFGQQEPGDAASIRFTCSTTYHITFPVFSKVDVRGETAHPLFAWLTSNLDSVLGREIKWNFTKFLVGREGTPLDRFLPLKPPRRLRSVVAATLGVPV